MMTCLAGPGAQEQPPDKLGINYARTMQMTDAGTAGMSEKEKRPKRGLSVKRS